MRQTSTITLGVTILCALAAPRAFAQASSPAPAEIPATPTGEGPPLRRVALTLDPVLLAPLGWRSIAQLTSEVRAGTRWGLVAVAGVGARSRADQQSSATTGELGGGARFYFAGTFESGWFVKTGFLYAALTHGAAPFLHSAPPLGLTWEAGVGRKWTTTVGLTVDLTLGGRYLVADAHQTVDTDTPRWTGLAALGVGWTL